MTSTSFVKNRIMPPASIGILGGGQLALYSAQSARRNGYKVWIIDPDKHAPAHAYAHEHLQTSYNDPFALKRLAQHCQVITAEFENVDSEALQQLIRHSLVRPAPRAFAICQNRILEKQFLADNQFPLAPYLAIEHATDINQARPHLFPGFVKTARMGYDGKNQATVRNAQQIIETYHQFGEQPIVCEKKLPLDGELSVIVAREMGGKTVHFPVIENAHVNGILMRSIVPARSTTIPEKIQQQAVNMAVEISHKMGFVGLLAVEFFWAEGKLWVNELAPRPHNSGHFSLDACTLSQFDLLLRVVCGLPLAQPQLQQNAVMLNLLGHIWLTGDTPHEPDWQKVFATPGANLHLYGKKEARIGRKMGHITVIDRDMTQALARAEALHDHYQLSPG